MMLHMDKNTKHVLLTLRGGYQIGDKVEYLTRVYRTGVDNIDTAYIGQTGTIVGFSRIDHPVMLFSDGLQLEVTTYQIAPVSFNHKL